MAMAYVHSTTVYGRRRHSLTYTVLDLQGHIAFMAELSLRVVSSCSQRQLVSLLATSSHLPFRHPQDDLVREPNELIQKSRHFELIPSRSRRGLGSRCHPFSSGLQKVWMNGMPPPGRTARNNLEAPGHIEERRTIAQENRQGGVGRRSGSHIRIPASTSSEYG
jgi:hypothetical protein